MNTLSTGLTCFLLLAGAPALAVTTVPAGGTQGQQRAERAPTAPAAPLGGAITSVDAAGGSIVISGQKFLISQPLVAIIDKRPKNDGLLNLATLRAGMEVRYRVDRSGGQPRVVELWVLRDGARDKR